MTPATWYSLEGLDARRPNTEALPDAAAQPGLHRRDPGQAAGRAGGPGAGALDRRAGPADPPPLVQAEGMAAGGVTTPEPSRSIRISSGGRPPQSQPRSRKGARSMPGGATQPAAP